MDDPFLGEICLAGFDWSPAFWAPCDGRLLNVADYPLLYELIKTTYGGDGKTTFAVPDLRSRVPIHLGNDGQGNNYHYAQALGTETVKLSSNQLGSHTHELVAASSRADQADPSGAYPAVLAGDTKFYASDPSGVRPLASNSTSRTGGGERHNNLMPFQCLNYVIALQGEFPMRA